MKEAIAIVYSDISSIKNAPTAPSINRDPMWSMAEMQLFGGSDVLDSVTGEDIFLIVDACATEEPLRSVPIPNPLYLKHPSRAEMDNRLST
ncbi:hypothetical protein [Geomonas limicola]|uniref:hypothetical protein n=1 Tax=Geomonas limicola TaxID=2740186 RepID=UPI00161FBDA8|nr:hypothetical protein [Geomonas limicola]